MRASHARGDVHVFLTADLKADFDDAASPVVATEFCGSSITSQGLPMKQVEAWAGDNPHIRFANSARRGYGLMELTQHRCVTRFRTVSDVTDPDASIRTLASWTVEDGRPGAQRGG